MAANEPDLIELISAQYNKFGYRIGDQSRRYRLRQTLLTVLVWLDFLYNFTTIPVPSDDHIRLSLVGDIGYGVFGERYRHIGTGISIFFRFYLVVMQTVEFVENHQWLARSNQLFHQLPTIQINSSLFKTVKKLRWIVLVITIIYMICPTACSVILDVIEATRGGEHQHYMTFYIYTPISIFFSTLFSGFFVVQYYLLCRVCQTILNQYQEQMNETLSQSKDLQQIMKHVRLFHRLYMMIQDIAIYLSRSYSMLLFCNFGLDMFFFYTVFYTQLSWFIRGVSLFVMFTFLTVLLYFSKIAEKIDIQAEKTANQLYQKVIVESKYLKQVTDCSKQSYQSKTIYLQDSQQNLSCSSELIRYFECIYGTTVGPTIMGNPINIENVIKMSTIFFTLLAILIKNIHF